ncbi:MAG: polyphosphate polymerase domain-containing protein [Bdellovibrionales bacterium]|nr:polyphosphate polymerase domain-containing protein [Bdellovibrionales bacterium]
MIAQDIIATPVSRFEIKYIVPKFLKTQIIQDISKIAVLDSNIVAGSNSYEVNSIYFDTSNLSAFYEKMAGVLHRKKFRIRYYGDDQSSASLEIKERLHDRILKRKDKLTSNEYENLTRGMHFSSNKKTLREYFYSTTLNSLRPVVTVSYQRLPFVGKNDINLRITLDDNIRVRPWLRGREAQVNYPLLSKGESVLEIKFNNVMPHWCEKIVEKYALTNTACSKYAMGLSKCASHGFFNINEDY